MTIVVVFLVVFSVWQKQSSEANAEAEAKAKRAEAQAHKAKIIADGMAVLERRAQAKTKKAKELAILDAELAEQLAELAKIEARVSVEFV